MEKIAALYRMETKDHICPFGLKAKYLLKKQGYKINDHLLKNREETNAFKHEYQVKTTPQIFIDEQRIGGYDELRSYFNLPPIKQEGTTYSPVIAIFSIALLLSLAFAFVIQGSIITLLSLKFFIAISMSILAIQKLQDLFSFSNSFITYDLLAMKLIPYAYIYPFLEAYAGIGMIAGLPSILVAPIALFIGTVGAVSVFKAVYIDKRELKCACVGGNSRVPLGFISLTENLFMILAGVWMLIS
ncbi:glutaredoxin family protein [Catenovulum sp. 2E275]|uniref:MauE/DoxX family redox-associated membrane protein n=1 Tax=Catenovulum sp. 2E275 TaxID=2980497 RepID=UPI0021CFE48F|nr:MauE/DoxX family redox-associated membrane protein [Catenovulum sp. 2E275]MCU4675846.1 glutaredoxin family protein [Catenovulum sp. 2E275]